MGEATRRRVFQYHPLTNWHVTWELHLATLREVRIDIGARMENIGEGETVFGPDGERVSVRGPWVKFCGNWDTDLWLIIRLPIGALRVHWSGFELLIDQKYLLTAEEMVIFPRNPDNVHDESTPIFMELFGTRAERLLIKHVVNTYMIRCERDYPAVVMPLAEYQTIALSLLRDFNFNGNPRPGGANHRRRAPLSPHTPNVSPPRRRRQSASSAVTISSSSDSTEPAH